MSLRVYVVENMPVSEACGWVALNAETDIRIAHRKMREWRTKWPKETFRTRAYVPAGKTVRSVSRSGYSDDCEEIGLWRGSVERAIRGKRGQSFLREMAEALDALPVKELIAGDVVRDSAHVCALGSVAMARQLDVTILDIDDGESVGKAFGIARALACEIAYENDETNPDETPAERWQRMRWWVDRQIAVTPPPTASVTK